MAFFPMTQFDFPNATYYDSNLREIIYAIKKLVSNYNEVVSQFNEIQTQFDEFKQVIDKLPDTITNEINAQIAEITPKLYEYLDTQLAVINTAMDGIKQSITQLEEKLTLQLQNIDAAWKVGDMNLDSKFTQITDEQRREYLSLIQEINTDIGNLQWDLPKIYNITKGTHDSITKVLYDVYDSVRVHAVTAGEYDALSLTAKEYDDFALTAIQFDVESKWYLDDSRVINPVSGERDNLQDILFDIMAYQTGSQGLTAEEYDSKDFNAEFYDSLGLTAFNYDYYGKMMFYAG